MKRTVLVNFSGGKDSTVATLEVLKHYPKEEVLLCWQDTGAEYLETEGHIFTIANQLELPLVIIRGKRTFWGDVLFRTKFPTPNCRHCTAHLKSDPALKWIRNHRQELGDELIVVSGIRAEESLRRSKLPEWEEHPTALKDGSFTAKTWYPCLDMKEHEIYKRIKAEGLPLHPCYDFSKRCSCWCCIFQAKSAVREYADQHPELVDKAIQVEDEIKHRWRNDISFRDLMAQGRLL